MKKTIILILGIFLLGAQSSLAQTTTEAAPIQPVSVEKSCMQTAVATREAALSTAFTKFSTTVTSAYSTRAAALDSAWSTTTSTKNLGENRSKGKASFTAFTKTVRDAKLAFKTEKNAAWNTFSSTAKNTCKVKHTESVVNEASL